MARLSPGGTSSGRRFTGPAVALLAMSSGCCLFHRTPSAPPGSVQVGVASWYGAEFQGDRTASGERFDPGELTAAHPSLPLGTRARITNLANGRSVVVRINDRGPFVRGRAIDLSHSAARALGMVGRGTTRVRIEPLGDGTSRSEVTRARAARRKHRPARR